MAQNARRPVGAPSPEVLMARLDEALGILSWWGTTSPQQRSWNWVIFQVLSYLSRSVILCFYDSLILRFYENKTVIIKPVWSYKLTRAHGHYRNTYDNLPSWNVEVWVGYKREGGREKSHYCSHMSTRYIVENTYLKIQLWA